MLSVIMANVFILKVVAPGSGGVGVGEGKKFFQQGILNRILGGVWNEFFFNFVEKFSKFDIDLKKNYWLVVTVV
jgi:hypothetical protein